MGEPLFLGYFLIYAMISYGFPLGCRLLLGQRFEFQDKAGMIIVIQHIYKALKTHRRIVNAYNFFCQLEEWDPKFLGRTDYVDFLTDDSPGILQGSPNRGPADLQVAGACDRAANLGVGRHHLLAAAILRQAAEGPGGGTAQRLKILGNHGETHSSPTCSLQNGEFLGIHHGIQHFPNKVIRRSNFEAKKVTKFSILEASLKR